MKRVSSMLILALLIACVSGCAAQAETTDIAATTLPVYQFTAMLCDGTGLTVTRLVTENVSCLHDYSLNVRQVKAAESADLIVISGAGLEDFMDDILAGKQTVDASANIALLQGCHHHAHDHDHEHEHEDHHDSEVDAHIWLSPDNALLMAGNICDGLIAQYPQHETLLRTNFEQLVGQIQSLQDYAADALEGWRGKEVITFHDGFSYLAQWGDFEIVKAIEEESGAEASAAELIEIIHLIRQHNIGVIFTECNGSTSAASIIAAETGVKVYALDMAMSGDSWFDAMYQNIDTLKEALG